MDVLGRYRNLIVLVGVLFAQVLGLAVQVRRTKDSEPTRLIRIWAVGSVTPLEKGLNWVRNTSGGIWHNYFYLRGVRAENRELKLEIERMRLEQARLSQDADQARRLQVLLAFKEQFISKTMAAQVIGSSGSELSRSVYIDKGSRDGLKPDMAVITKDGIVGKVLRVYRATSLVLLINDQTSGVGSILEKTRLQGILRGTSSGETVLERVMSDETVPLGEQVLTSGGDGIFPKGLPVGMVTKVSTGSDLFLNIRVRPSAELSRLEEVLVVTQVDERQAQPDNTAAMRAVDILAQRLPSVPPKPATPEGGAKNPAAAPGGAAKPAAPGVPQPGQPAGQPKPKSPSAPGQNAVVTPGSAAPKPNAGAPSTPDGKKGSVAFNSGTAIVGTPNSGAPAIKKSTSPASSSIDTAGGTQQPATPVTKKPAPKPATPTTSPAVSPKPESPPQDNPQ